MTTSEGLSMDVAFVSEFPKGRMLFRKLFGDTESFGRREGGVLGLTRLHGPIRVERSGSVKRVEDGQESQLYSPEFKAEAVRLVRLPTIGISSRRSPKISKSLSKHFANG